MRRRAFLSALLVFTSVAAVVLKPAEAAVEIDPIDQASFAFRVFRDVQGLPQNTVHTITVDTLGRLWIGTQDGAAFYDGSRWHAVDMPSRLYSNFVRSILAASDGSLWFGTRAGGLFRLKDEQWSEAKTLCVRAGCPRVNTLAETSSETGQPIIWAGTYGGGLGRLENDQWKIYTTEDGLPSNRIWGLLADKDDSTLWVGTEGGLAVLRPGSDRFAVEEGFPVGSVNSIVRIPAEDGRGPLWIGTYGKGLFRGAEDGHWRQVTTGNGLPSDFITSLVLGTSIGGGASLWAGTDGGGLVRISHDNIDTISVRTGLPSNAVYSLFETHPPDAPSMLWVGTRNGGLAQLVEGSWKRMAPADSPHVAPVNAFLETPTTTGSRSLWLGTDGEGLYRLADGQWTHFTKELPTQTIQCLGRGRDLNGYPVLWAGARNGGLVKYSQEGWSLFTEESGALPSNMVQAVVESRSEDGATVLWVGTRYGLARLSSGRWKHIESIGDQSLGSVLSLLETEEADGGKKLWIGSTEGLATYRHGQWKMVNGTLNLLNTAVQCLFEQIDALGRRRIWVGTDGGGVTVLDAEDGDRPLFTLTDTSAPALPSPVVNGIVGDLEGRIYLLTNSGVARLTPTASDVAGADEFSLIVYTTEDGLPLNEGNKGAAFVDDDGRIWIGTVGGAAVLDPSEERRDRHADELLLEAFQVSDPGTHLSQGVTLDHRHKHIVFSFALLSYFKENETRFRTQLIGLDEQPTAWTPESRREYQTLDQGAYTFRVWGRDFAGNVSGPVDFGFEVEAAPWETWWAKLLMVLAVIFAMSLGFQARIRSMRTREQQLSRLVESRTRELAAANEALVDLSYTDSLTGIGNRRRFDQFVETEWRRGIRFEQSLALILIDIDHFKKFNDEFGHPEGDECLKAVATTISDCFARSSDSVARFGGDEFAVVLPGTDLKGALMVAEQLRCAIEKFEDRCGPAPAKPPIEVSCGVSAVIPSAALDPQDLLKAADNGLYRAKLGGRNRVAAGSLKGREA